MIVMILSFLLDGILSNLLKEPFLPLFSLVSIVVMYACFNNNESKYLKYCALLGLLYDIVYTNTLFLNFFVFIIIGLIVIIFSYFLSNRVYIDILIMIVSVLLYRFLTLLFAIIFNNTSFSFSLLLESIYNSLIINLIYTLLLFPIVHKIYKHKLLK